MTDIDNNILEEKKEKILGFVKSKEYKPMKINDIMMFMEVPIQDRELFMQIINELLLDGKLVLTQKGKIMTPEALNMVYGTYTSTSRGFGFVTVEDDDIYNKRDIFIHEKNTNGAMHKDKVLCQITENDTGKRPEGVIIKVLEKGLKHIVGTFEQSKSFGFVVPDEKKMYNDIFIPKKYTLGAVTGHKVVVEIIKHAENGKKPEGKVTEIIGHINDPGVDILSIIKQFDLPTDFDDLVYKQIENIPTEVLDEEKTNRLDLRNTQTVTIDGEDAKDLDDAITIQKLENGNYKLGVHIADVTHYVKESTPLDREALKRGTSVYLVDRVIPMLPHKLSNGICSLNQKEDRLALSCIMEIDKEGNVYNHQISETIINVDKRMSYNIVNSILTDENSPYLEENKDFLTMFKTMEELRNILLAKRMKRGAIEFDFQESKIVLDEKRKPIDIKLYERNVATSIIEEFMLVANETVAENYFWLEIPFVYRSHEEPDIEKIEEMSEFISKFGYKLKGSNIHSKAFQKILEKAKGKPEEMIVSRVVLRSFKQARYTPKNEGHFGLAAKYYCHFTSPIRRYPDLQIHRIIKEHIKGNLDEKRTNTLVKKLPDVCLKCSNRERVAEEAERETCLVKKIEYMEDKVGQIFEGVISGVTSWGIYVELPNTIEGMVSPKIIEDDYYYYDEKNMQYFGEKTGKRYSLGDIVKVKLISTNMYERTIDFKFVLD
ncbi:ribonuclease R [[Clostridium] colinum]|uniref:ribonuclease R n=1 Tax=[Clostridium] colinum TaxID=36835 RepID=UPI0020243141|nr:ribonuclease R [[Clostridium] colinum]